MCCLEVPTKEGNMCVLEAPMKEGMLCGSTNERG